MTSFPSETNPISEQVEPIIWLHPRSWPANNRIRKYISLAERNVSRETELGILRRSAEFFLRRQDERGSFYTDAEYRQADSDDQLGGAAVLAYFLSQTEPKAEIIDALERAVRFYLEHLVWKSPSRRFRYTRAAPDQEANEDWCGNMWCLWGGAQVLRHGADYLSSATAAELRELMEETWQMLSAYPVRDEQPCHNQLLAYCDISVLLGQTIGNEAIVREALHYYHGRLRRLRIHDRGHWIYSEFNQWDVHYGQLVLMSLEHLFAATGDPAVAEDADEMALYFNEMVSAGGYCWGGPRNNECGYEEFPHIFAALAVELGLNRLLLPEPSNLWRQLAMDGHGGNVLVNRMDVTLPHRKRGPVSPTSWYFQKDEVSVCLQDDFKLHQLSSAGLELIPAANAAGVGSGIVWLKDGVWKSDFLQQHPPKASEGHHYSDGKPMELRELNGLSAMQRGYSWETRQWWIGNGKNLLWVVQLFAHGIPRWDRLEYVLGTPVLTRMANQAVPVTTAKSAEGIEVDTQGDAATISSRKFISFGDVMIGATLPLEFNRPSKEAFHTFPITGRNWRDCTSSNEVRLRISESPGQIESRKSIFFAIGIGNEVPALELTSDQAHAIVESKLGTFRARQLQGIWDYTFEGASGEEELSSVGFGYRP